MGVDVLAVCEDRNNQEAMEKEMIHKLGWCEPRRSGMKLWQDDFADILVMDDSFWVERPKLTCEEIRDRIGYVRTLRDRALFKGDANVDKLVMWLEIMYRYDASMITC